MIRITSIGLGILVALIAFSGCQSAAPETPPESEIVTSFLLGPGNGSLRRVTIPNDGRSLRNVLVESGELGTAQKAGMVIIRRANAAVDLGIDANFLDGLGGNVPVLPNDTVTFSSIGQHFPDNTTSDEISFVVQGLVLNGQTVTTDQMVFFSDLFTNAVLDEIFLFPDGPRFPETFSVLRVSPTTGRPTNFYFSLLTEEGESGAALSPIAEQSTLGIRDGDVITFSNRRSDALLRASLLANRIRAQQLPLNLKR
ncbi:MAG: hypothetical protein AAFN77_03755 [Planctomycetota bacterium]